MAADEAALVLVMPNDDIKTIITKVQRAGRSDVELLVPEGADTLQSLDRCVLLRRSAERDGIRLLLISSDEETLAAARKGKIETVGFKDGRVIFHTTPVPTNGDGNTYATNKLPETATPPPSPINESDADFLRSLDALPLAASSPPARRESTGSSRDDDFMSDLDDLSAMMDMGRETQATDRSSTPYDAFAAELDDWSSGLTGTGATGGATTPGPAHPAADRPPPEPRRRVSVADIELTPEEKARANRKPVAASQRIGSGTARSTPSNREQAGREQRRAAPAPKRGTPSWVLPLLVILLLIVLLIGLMWLSNRFDIWNRIAVALPFDPPFASSVTITVLLPPPITEPQPIIAQPILRTQVGTGASDLAVQAEEIRAMVVYTTTGEVATETLAPAGSAQGLVTLYNQSTTREFEFPQGTEFIATNPQGREVTFASDAPFFLGTATTSRKGAQIITTLGEAQTKITARTPGSDSNVDANTIYQIAIPGQYPITPNTGDILIEHGPLTGGTEQPIRVVKDTDVQAALQPALTGLINRARQVLEAELNNRNSGLILEKTTVTPDAEDFSRGEGYRQTIIPPIGQTVDPTNPFFTIVVEAQFSALATPPGQSLKEQLQVALSNQLASEGRLPRGTGPGITHWHWDGSRLTVDGVLQPTGEGETLDDKTRQQILSAIRGKSRAEAAAALDTFVAQGVIRNYTIPEDVDVLPKNRLVVKAVGE